MNRLTITVSALGLALTLVACGSGDTPSDPGNVVDTAKRSVTVKLDSGTTVTYPTSKKVARRCRKAEPKPARWPDCRSAF
jgi:ABC-type Fe3+-hydroxamate transport system substrate-binding protein